MQRPGCKNSEPLITLDPLFTVRARVLGVVNVLGARTTI